MKVADFLDEFVKKLKAQLDDDQKRWGETWRQRGLKNQEKRIFQRFRDYWDMFINGGARIPWMKVAGLALIAWIRETHPEVLVNPNDDCDELKI